jgi:hypothetical protein
MPDPTPYPPAGTLPAAGVPLSRRPGGVVAAAVVLGFVSLGMILFALLMLVGALYFHHSPQAVASTSSMPPGTVPPSQAVMIGMMAFFAIIFATLGIWGIATLVGLLRLKPWARISVMIQGGLLAVLGLLGALGGASIPLMMKNAQLPSTISPQQMSIMVAAAVSFYGVLALLGIWWVVYFAMRSGRTPFEPPAHVLASQEIPVRRLRPAGPITDFTVAQPMEEETPDEER